MVSYTKVQQTPPAYNGRQTLQFVTPASADQPRSAPQLNASPGMKLNTTETAVREMTERLTKHGLRPMCHPLHERVDSYDGKRRCAEEYAAHFEKEAQEWQKYEIRTCTS